MKKNLFSIQEVNESKCIMCLANTGGIKRRLPSNTVPPGVICQMIHCHAVGKWLPEKQSAIRAGSHQRKWRIRFSSGFKFTDWYFSVFLKTPDNGKCSVGHQKN